MKVRKNLFIDFEIRYFFVQNMQKNPILPFWNYSPFSSSTEFLEEYPFDTAAYIQPFDCMVIRTIAVP